MIISLKVKIIIMKLKLGMDIIHNVMLSKLCFKLGGVTLTPRPEIYDGPEGQSSG